MLITWSEIFVSATFTTRSVLASPFISVMANEKVGCCVQNPNEPSNMETTSPIMIRRIAVSQCQYERASGSLAD